MAEQQLGVCSGQPLLAPCERLIGLWLVVGEGSLSGFSNIRRVAIVRALREDQPLRLLLNFLFYHFNHSEPSYKSKRIKLLFSNIRRVAFVCALREDQPLRLLLNLLFYHFNHSEPSYKSRRIKLLFSNIRRVAFVRALREDQPLRLLLNLLFYHFNHSEPSYKSQRIKPLNVIATCNELDVNALN